ncbi:MAG TPA: YgjP-like metallopeptidase domain-containing protein, partial [Burkholderiaceae bacterium]
MRRAATPDPNQFALFDAAASAAQVPAPEASVRAAEAAAEAVPATPPAPFEAAVPLASVLTPATFRHPLADRETRLDQHVVAYALKRARRRSIGFIVGPEGLSVNAPKWVGLGDIEAALQEKSNWILRKLREQQERAQRLQQAKVDWRDGTTIPFLGDPVIIVLDPRATGAVLHADDVGALPGVAHRTLHIGLPQHASAAQIRDAVQSWLQRQARRVFEERCQLFTQRLGVRYTRLSL